MTRFHKTALNLVVIDFTEIEEWVTNQYRNQLNSWGVIEESIKDAERDRLKLFLYTKGMSETVLAHGKSRNIVFYVTNTECRPYLEAITKYMPFIVHYGDLDFKWIQSEKGESREILESVRTTRMNFDYSKYTAQKSQQFYKKFKIQQF